jgi:hypothetical protein
MPGKPQSCAAALQFDLHPVFFRSGYLTFVRLTVYERDGIGYNAEG